MSPRSLFESGSPFRTLVEQLPIMLWMSNTAGAPVLFNRDWRHFRGLASDTPVPAGWSHGIHDDDRDAALAAFHSSHATASPYVGEYRVIRADGQTRWLHDHGMPLFDSTGAFAGHMGVCVDVTDQRTFRAPAHSVRRLTQLVEQSRDMVYRVRLTPTVQLEYVGGAVQAITGRTPDEWYADPLLIHSAVHPDDVHQLATTADHVARTVISTTFRWVHPDGRIVWAEHFRMPIFDSAGHIVGIEALARDVTHRIDTDRRLRESEEQMRQLAARLQAAREEERAEVSRELHDELGQTLTALKLEINRAVAVFDSGSSNVNTVDRLQSVVGLVDLGIGMVKRISARLRPATLDHLGLAEAIKWEAATFKARTGIRCQLRANRRQTRLDSEQQTALFRIVQEALNNVLCHANASAVQVSIKETDTGVDLSIRDNGKGITAAQAAAPKSIGLLGMKERAARVGASFTIAGKRGKGTVVSVHVPLHTALAGQQPRRTTESERR